MPVYQDIARNTWFIKFHYRNPSGLQRSKTKRGFGSEQAAEEWEKRFKNFLAEGLDMTLKEFVELYREERFSRLKKTTRIEKESILNSIILPLLGEKILREINCNDVIRWHIRLLSYRDKKGRPYSKAYLRTIHNQLSAILAHAVNYYSLPSNPAAMVGNIGNAKQLKYWTMDEFEQFIYVMMEKPAYYYFFLLLYWTGITENEALALQQSDFDFNKKTLSIKKTLIGCKQEHSAPSKLIRAIPIPDDICTEMQEFLNSFPAGVSPTSVFVGLSRAGISRALKIGAQRACIKPILVKDLRHSYVAQLINEGTNATEIARRIGCESIFVVNTYGFLFPNVENELEHVLNELGISEPTKGGILWTAKQTNKED